jgi:hypothetical protein
MAANQHVFLLESLTSCPSGGAPHVHGATVHKTLSGAQAMATQEAGAVIEWAEGTPGEGLPWWRGMVAGKVRWRISEELLRD